MSVRVLVLVVATAAFAALTTVAHFDVGYLGVIEPHFKSWGAAQVVWDLVILAALAIVWMVRDARARGANPWPFVVLTLAGGSFGPLAYFIVREWRGTRAGRRSSGPSAPTRSRTRFSDLAGPSLSF